MSFHFVCLLLALPLVVVVVVGRFDVGIGVVAGVACYHHQERSCCK